MCVSCQLTNCPAYTSIPNVVLALVLVYRLSSGCKMRIFFLLEVVIRTVLKAHNTSIGWYYLKADVVVLSCMAI